MTDSEDELDQNPRNQKPRSMQFEFDNSVLRIGRSLLAASRENPIIGPTRIPTVTLRFTRLDPTPSNEQDYDYRISRTIDELLSMGIDVQLGERTATELSLCALNCSSNAPPQVHPTRNVNLDLSVLIALVSDLTHAPLPRSVADAEARFTPSTEYIEWKKRRLLYALKNRSANASQEEVSVNSEPDPLMRPSRNLVAQAMQEVGMGLFEEMHDRLSPLLKLSRPYSGFSDPRPVEFWTTQEAKERCMRIVEKIGGPHERRRAEALFCADVKRAEQGFWRESRYPAGFVPLFPLRIFPPGPEGTENELGLLQLPIADRQKPSSPFFRALEKTCRSILAQDTIPNPRVVEDLSEIQRATVTKANPRLTAHTVQSILWGARLGWTTLTANKTNVKAILREMRATRGGLLWNRGDEPSEANGDDVHIGSSTSPPSHEGGLNAALWIVHPRSLAESMRADFGS